MPDQNPLLKWLKCEGNPETIFRREPLLFEVENKSMTNTCKRGHPRTPENTYVYSDGGRRCKTCKDERNRDYRAANREKVLESNRKWKANNPEKMREYRRKYREDNPQKVRSQLRKYRALKHPRGSPPDPYP